MTAASGNSGNKMSQRPLSAGPSSRMNTNNGVTGIVGLGPNSGANGFPDSLRRPTNPNMVLEAERNTFPHQLAMIPPNLDNTKTTNSVADDAGTRSSERL